MSLEFNSVQVTKPRSNMFDLSHDRKFSLNMGQLVPIMCTEVLPGDKFSVKNEQLIRFAPMLAPIMHKVDVYTHYFFVPNRLVWDNWDEFITGNQGEAPSPAFPYFRYVTGDRLADIGMLGDYLGLPSDYIAPDGLALPQNIDISALPLAAYIKIYNEYYRDQNLIEEIKCDIKDGMQDENDFGVLYTDMPLRRAWEHDYFTSALPWTQKGEEVFLTFDSEGALPIEFNSSGNPSKLRDMYGNTLGNIIAGDFGHVDYTDGDDTGHGLATVDNSADLQVDLEGTYLMTVNELRKAMAIQRWLELNARGGSRYIETILVHFGVKSPDARLQRPEYLGGGKSNVSISEVLQMSQSDTTPQGTMAGHGINYGSSHEFTSSFVEHGYIIGIMSVMPKTSYQQGLPRHFTKFDKLDYFWHTFAHLGEQEVKNKEVYISSRNPDGTFGYLPRYTEYKYLPSSVHGDMRSSLDYWHMSRIFSEEPALNEDFITCNPDNRIFAVTDDNVHHLWCHIYQKVKAIRPIPLFSTPALF